MKILERLEEELRKSEEKYHRYLDDSNLPCMFDKSDIEETRVDIIKEMLEIVQEVAEEYNSGWIPCSVDLPKEKDGIVLICCEDGNVMTGKYSEFDDTWFKGDMYAVGGSNVIAWQSLPEPYKERV